MVRRIKKSIVGIIDWFLYTVLSTKQKEFLAGFLSKKQKEKMKRVIKPGKKRAQMRQVERVKSKLYNLGFIDEGLRELQELLSNENEPNLKRLADWEHALWHANQYSKENAATCINYLPDAIKDVGDTYILRRAAILEAESLHILGQTEEAKSVIENALASKMHADLYLAMASLEDDITESMKWMNQALSLTDEDPITLNQDNSKDAYDRLVVANPT